MWGLIQVQRLLLPDSFLQGLGDLVPELHGRMIHRSGSPMIYTIHPERAVYPSEGPQLGWLLGWEPA